MKRPALPLLFIVSLVISCTGEQQMRHAAAGISPEQLRKYTMTLGSDSFMGRKPFTEGEEITVKYLAGALEEIGFEPLFNGSWYQDVPMTEISSAVTGPAVVKGDGFVIRLQSPDDIAIESPSLEESVSLENIPMVFCGFGIVAPEYGWDDYSGLDLKGKCAVVLVNDPGLYSGDTTLFKGRTMTWYGRWPYKYDEAARHGAAAVLIIHETTGAGYDYSIPRKSSLTSNLYMEQNEGDATPCKVTGWLNGEAAGRLFATMELRVDSLRKEACSPEFKGFDMDMTLSVSLRNSIVRNISRNVAGILKGKKRDDECIIISGHWDHFGIGEPEKGDSIYNGAVDNGTTMAWALEIGRAFSSLKKRADRSVIILFPTAEEEGLLGSSYFAAHPPVSPEDIIACFNNDMMLPEGRMKDMMVTGYGQSELEDMLGEAVAGQDRYILPDPSPESGMYFRSDHFPFARIGVPSLFARGNCDSRANGKEWASEREHEYLTARYHKPADNYYPEMDFSGIAEDAAATFEVAYRIVYSDIRPAWKPGSEFANIRSSSK